jgi:hypothetical protein
VPEGGYVSRRLLQLVMPVFPDRRMFRIHDPEVDPEAPGSPMPPVGVLITANREQLWIGSLQQDIDVRLVLEEWDGQPLLPDAWDEEAKARLYLRGQLTVDMGSAGTAVQRLRLSGGVGNYEIRVYARYREAVVQMYSELFRQHKDPLSDEFQREKRKLEGVERYLIQLWRDSLRQGACAAGDVAARVDVLAVLAVPALAAPAVPPVPVPTVAWLPEVLVLVLMAAELAVADVPATGPAFAGAAIEAWPDACGLVTDFGLCARNGIMA